VKPRPSRTLGVNKVMWGSGYPHHEVAYPYFAGSLQRSFHDWTEAGGGCPDLSGVGVECAGRVEDAGRAVLVVMVVSVGEPTGGDDVDIASEQVFERVWQVKRVEQGAAGFGLDKKTDVAGFGPDAGDPYPTAAWVLPLPHWAGRQCRHLRQGGQKTSAVWV